MKLGRRPAQKLFETFEPERPSGPAGRFRGRRRQGEAEAAASQGEAQAAVRGGRRGTGWPPGGLFHLDLSGENIGGFQVSPPGGGSALPQGQAQRLRRCLVAGRQEVRQKGQTTGLGSEMQGGVGRLGRQEKPEGRG
ncbi:MAG: hypothetical protein ACE5HD_10020 [Acidobacteriota bacterium]